MKQRVFLDWARASCPQSCPQKNGACSPGTISSPPYQAAVLPHVCRAVSVGPTGQTAPPVPRRRISRVAYQGSRALENQQATPGQNQALALRESPSWSGHSKSLEITSSGIECRQHGGQVAYDRSNRSQSGASRNNGVCLRGSNCGRRFGRTSWVTGRGRDIRAGSAAYEPVPA